MISPSSAWCLRFPGVDSVEQYWELLASGTDALQLSPASRTRHRTPEPPGERRSDPGEYFIEEY